MSVFDATTLAKAEPIIVEGITNFDKDDKLHAPEIWEEKTKNFDPVIDENAVIKINLGTHCLEDFIVPELARVNNIKLNSVNQKFWYDYASNLARYFVV